MTENSSNVKGLDLQPTLMVLAVAAQVQTRALLKLSQCLQFEYLEEVIELQELDAVLTHRIEVLNDRRTSEIDWPAHDLQQIESEYAAQAAEARARRLLTEESPDPENQGEENTQHADS